MAISNIKTIFLVAALACTLAYNTSTASARPLSAAGSSSSASSIVARLKLDEASSGCWDSLIQLQDCTGEIILFFLNGETYLGHGCCNAIRTITNRCWPNLIDTLGFTSEEGDILEGYCDKATATPPASIGSSTTITSATIN